MSFKSPLSKEQAYQSRLQYLTQAVNYRCKDRHKSYIRLIRGPGDSRPQSSLLINPIIVYNMNRNIKTGHKTYIPGIPDWGERD